MDNVIQFPLATFIIADDDSGIRETMSEFLTMCGYRIFEAPRAEDALEVLGKHRVDLMTTDVSKPGMDGYELTRIVKSKYGIPVIIATGYRANTETEARDAGADLFFHKPIKFNEMLLSIRNLLS